MKELTERQKEVFKIYQDLEYNEERTVDKLGISLTNVRKTLFYVAKKGFPITPAQEGEGEFEIPAAPPGYNIKKSTIQGDKNKGTVRWWHRVEAGPDLYEQFIKGLEARCPVIPEITKGPKTFDPNIMVEWKLMDHHMGMYAWAEETGNDYDINIAKDLVIKSAKKIFGRTGPVDTAVIILGGDTLHMDNRTAETERGKNRLDVDTRFAKAAWCAEGTMLQAIDIALGVAKNVIVIVLSGNHDYHSAIWLSRILAAHYKNNDRVTVDTSPKKHKHFRWGSTFFTYTHGDNNVLKKVPALMLNEIIKRNLTGIIHKRARIGHFHQQKKDMPPGLVEQDGVFVELFPTLAAIEAYGVEAGYQNTRATICDFFHKKYGKNGGIELGIMELMET
jgi:hypothetical protein